MMLRITVLVGVCLAAGFIAGGYVVGTYASKEMNGRFLAGWEAAVNQLKERIRAYSTGNFESYIIKCISEMEEEAEEVEI